MDKKIKVDEADFKMIVDKLTYLENMVNGMKTKETEKPAIEITNLSAYIFESQVLYQFNKEKIVEDNASAAEFKKELEVLMIRYHMLKAEGIFIHKFN